MPIVTDHYDSLSEQPRIYSPDCSPSTLGTRSPDESFISAYNQPELTADFPAADTAVSTNDMCEQTE